MDDHEAMLAIQDLLDGQQWNAETLDKIAAIIVEAGYRIGTLDEADLKEVDETTKAVEEVIDDIPLTDPKGG